MLLFAWFTLCHHTLLIVFFYLLVLCLLKLWLSFHSLWQMSSISSTAVYIVVWMIKRVVGPAVQVIKEIKCTNLPSILSYHCATCPPSQHTKVLYQRCKISLVFIYNKYVVPPLDIRTSRKKNYPSMFAWHIAWKIMFATSSFDPLDWLFDLNDEWSWKHVALVIGSHIQQPIYNATYVVESCYQLFWKMYPWQISYTPRDSAYCFILWKSDHSWIT